MRPLVIAVDFDGTCVESAFPSIGAELPGAVETLKELARRGHKLALWTCREDHGAETWLSYAVAWFEGNGIPLRSVNETHPDDMHPEVPKTARGRKAYADLYVDDKNLGGFPGWAKVLEHVNVLAGCARGCCDRMGEYNGYGSDGPTTFTCPRSCACHD